MPVKTRPIVEIDRELCNGCKICLHVCGEAALELDEDGKARLVGESLCDGLGACLDVCPVGALKVVRREAEAFDEAAMHAHVERSRGTPPPQPAPTSPVSASGCPGSQERVFQPVPSRNAQPAPSELSQWPIQLHLVSPASPRFRGADLLVAADCTAFALGSFHADLLRGKALAIACPKLDRADGYVEKLAEIVRTGEVRSVTVAIMDVPCCQGLHRMVESAVEASGRNVPLRTRILPVQR